FRAGVAMQGAHSAERTASLARRMVREVLAELGPGADPPRFVLHNGPLAHTRIELREPAMELTLGRGDDVTFALHDADASRRHASVRRDWQGVFVTDLGSKNGVLVNGVRITGEQQLHDGDELLVGSTRLQFDDPAEAYLREIARASDTPREPPAADP